MAEDQPYVNIRTLLGCFVGKTVFDVTQHDESEWVESRDSYVLIMFNDGSSIKFPIGDDGFVIDCECPAIETEGDD